MLQNQHNFSQHATLLHKPINSIAPHDQYGDLESLLAETDYMLSSGDMFSDEVLMICFLQHPVVVIRSKAAKERFLCVSNIRSFMLAHTILKYEEELPVMLIDRPSTEEISLLVSTDLLVSPLLYSLRGPQPVGRVYKKLKKDKGDVLNALFQARAGTKAELAHQTGYALNTIFTPPHSNESSRK